MERLLGDPDRLSDTVRFDETRLGGIQGAAAVHLQCHIGTDTLSLARLGAEVVGLDFSAESIRYAEQLVASAHSPVAFICADVYDALAVLEPSSFDLVYTGVGALCWLPDIMAWAHVVAGLLRPGGRLFLREAHPMLWTLDDQRADTTLAVERPYAETADPLVVLDDDTTYVRTARRFTRSTRATWNHGLGEIVTALLRHGLTLTDLVEHDSVPWLALPGQMDRTAGGEWRLRDRPERLPHSYTLQALMGRAQRSPNCCG